MRKLEIIGIASGIARDRGKKEGSSRDENSEEATVRKRDEFYEIIGREYI